jgi:hypothetical protein
MSSVLSSIFKPFGQVQTYSNFVLLLAQLPIGIVHFVFLATGFFTTIGLAFSVVGVPFAAAAFLATLIVARLLANAEFAVLRGVFGDSVQGYDRVGGDGLLDSTKSLVTSMSTWKAVLLSALRLPLGLVSFVITTTYVAVTVGLLAAPFVYQAVRLNVGQTVVLTLADAVIASVAGLILLVVGAHLILWGGRGVRYVLRGLSGR